MFLPPCAVAERRAVAGALRTVWTSKRNSVDVVVAWFVHSGPLTSNSGLLLLLATPRATPDWRDAKQVHNKFRFVGGKFSQILASEGLRPKMMRGRRKRASAHPRASDLHCAGPRMKSHEGPRTAHADLPAAPQISPDLPRSRQIAPDPSRSPARSPHTSPDLARLPRSAARLSRSRPTSPDLPAAPPDLARSDQISSDRSRSGQTPPGPRAISSQKHKNAL